MTDAVTTSWRRLSDKAQKHADLGSTRDGQAPSVQAEAVQQLQTWENEGGQSALSIKSLRILIVDDDIASSSSVERMLHAAGYLETRVAYSGCAALAIAADFRPSVVLLELNLLDMSGYEVARLLSERCQSQDLRVFALTARHKHAGSGRARVPGFERCLLKPVVALDLSRLLETAVARDQRGRGGALISQLEAMATVRAPRRPFGQRWRDTVRCR